MLRQSKMLKFSVGSERAICVCGCVGVWVCVNGSELDHVLCFSLLVDN